MINCTAQLLELIVSPCQVTVTAPPQVSLVVTLSCSEGISLAQSSRHVARAGDARRVGVGDSDGLRAGRAIAALVRRPPVSAADVKLARTIARTNRVPLPTHRHRPAQLSLVVTLLVFGAGTWLAQLTVKLLGQVMLGGLVSLTVMVCVQEALFAALVARTVSAADDKLTDAIARTDRVSLPNSPSPAPPQCRSSSRCWCSGQAPGWRSSRSNWSGR